VPEGPTAATKVLGYPLDPVRLVEPIATGPTKEPVRYELPTLSTAMSCACTTLVEFRAFAQTKLPALSSWATKPA